MYIIVPLFDSFSLSLPMSLGNHWSTFCHYRLFSGILYKLNYTILIFFVWLLLTQHNYFRLIHDFVCIIAVSFLMLNSVSLCWYANIFGCFQHFPITNKAVMNVSTQVFVQKICTISRNRKGGWYGNKIFILLFRNCPTVFQRHCTINILTTRI